jgi:hypothetical protein
MIINLVSKKWDEGGKVWGKGTLWGLIVCYPSDILRLGLRGFSGSMGTILDCPQTEV